MLQFFSFEAPHGSWRIGGNIMLRKTFFFIAFAFVFGCGDEGLVQIATPPENVPAAPSWTPDAITIDELVFPYAAKQAVGVHNVQGEEFRLASCEVLYRSRRVRLSEENNRWVRLSTGQSPHHATNWTHDGVPQFLYIFLNFDNEADFQRFTVGTHTDIPFKVVGAFSIVKNTWELKLRYVSASETIETETIETQNSTAVVRNATSTRFTANAATDYFYAGTVYLNGVALTGVAYDASGLTLRAAIGQRTVDIFPNPLRLVLTQKSAPTRDSRFGRRIEFTYANIRTHGRFAYIRHDNLSAEQSKDLRLMGEDIQAGDIFHLYVYKQ